MFKNILMIGAIALFAIILLIIIYGISGLIFWGIGSFVVWAFKISFIWTFWHGLVVAILFSLLKQLFDRD